MSNHGGGGITLPPVFIFHQSQRVGSVQTQGPRSGFHLGVCFICTTLCSGTGTITSQEDSNWQEIVMLKDSLWG